MSKLGLLTIASLLFILSACSNDSDTSDGVVDATLIDAMGETHKISDYRGKWIVLNYWATWCPPCVEEMPMLSEFHVTHDNVVVLGVAQEPLEPDALKAFTAKLDVSYPVFPGFPNQLEELNALFPLRGLPTTYFINPQGKVIDKTEGPITLAQLQQILK